MEAQRLLKLSDNPSIVQASATQIRRTGFSAAGIALAKIEGDWRIHGVSLLTVGRIPKRIYRRNNRSETNENNNSNRDRG